MMNLLTATIVEISNASENPSQVALQLMDLVIKFII